ncbi:DUF2628 domain-containing protein [Escherichia coli]|nr:DUF2628 domain-containing protein [Escherichia coli]EIY9320282.1 DUF2628 domain-containing protein [Escherichia coli]EJA8028758.1 DUF2628 domain-containing protein [Escherichia coli]EJH3277874.1 DUF2628 domain-containing protein [Escherichia coli]EJQ5605939.1 DUF2628 domain-containing protein [Escherichia coli]
MSKDYMADGSLTEKWKYRFSFYDEHGFPGFWGTSPEYKQALKGLNTRQKIIIRTNVIAFFFSWVYLFVLGLWKKAIVVLFLAIFSLIFGYMIGYNVFGFIIAAYVSYNTNRWFYEKEVKGIHTWSL